MGLAACGKMIKRKKHPVIGCFFFVQILACFDGYHDDDFEYWLKFEVPKLTQKMFELLVNVEW